MRRSSEFDNQSDTMPVNPNADARRRRLTTIALLGFFSGLPLALTDSSLQAWLVVNDIDVTTIGWFSLLGLPYVLKVLWAPLLDRYSLPWLGRRRGWIAAMQFAVGIIILLLAGRDPSNEILVIAGLALLLAVVSSTQDIAFDAYRAECLRPQERGLGVGLSVAGYKIATIVSGAGALIIADQFGFSVTYVLIAGLAFGGLLVTVTAREVAPPIFKPQNFNDAFVKPFSAFFQRPDAIALLFLVLIYKIGDAAVGRVSIVFFSRALDLSLSEIGALYKGLGLGASLVGGVFGGVLMMRWGLYRSLFAFAVMQTLTNLGFVGLAIVGKSYLLVVFVVGLENFSGGLGTAALVALLIAMCDQKYTATQFAFFTGIATLGRILVGPAAGAVVDNYGWLSFYAATILLALPSLGLLIYLRAIIIRLDESQHVD
ncbi:MAG: PAT family beta-lactamase induction signal transducer AmpG [Gammaproteobacteria bacterium]